MKKKKHNNSVTNLSTADILYKEVIQDIQSNPHNWECIQKHISPKFANKNQTIIIKVDSLNIPNPQCDIIEPEDIKPNSNKLRMELGSAVRDMLDQYGNNITEFVLERWRGTVFVMMPRPTFLTINMKEDLEKCKYRWAVGDNYIWFENEQDAMFWKLRHSGSSEQEQDDTESKSIQPPF